MHECMHVLIDRVTNLSMDGICKTGSPSAAAQRSIAASRADCGANEGAFLFTGSRPRRRAAAAVAGSSSSCNGIRLFSAAAAGGAAAGGEGDAAAAAAAAAAKVMAEVNAGMKEALPQLNSVLSKKVRSVRCRRSFVFVRNGRESLQTLLSLVRHPRIHL